MNQVSLDAQEMKDFLYHIIENNRHIQAKGLNSISTEIIGESGLGKTSIALQIAEEKGLNFVKLNLAQIEELGDLVGFPLRQFQMCKGGTTTKKLKLVQEKNAEGKFVMVKKEVAEDVEPECLWIDENAIDEYTKQGYRFTGEKRMSYCPPEWIADKTGGGILILDDWNRADIRFIQAVMELVDRQEYISWKLPKDWHIVLTANPDNGEYLVNAIDNAQRTRFVSINLKWQHERWAEWAEKQEIDTRCINFVLMHPEVINEKVNPRSITTFFNAISSIEKFEDSLGLVQMIGEGSVGPEVATLFSVFINNRLDQLITPKEILMNPNEKATIDKLSNCIGTGQDYRADIASIMTTRVVNYALYFAESNPVTKEVIDRLVALVKHPDAFTNDLKYHLVKKILNGNKQKFQKLLFDTKVQELATK